MRESQDEKVEMEEDDVRAVRLFQGWLYSGRIEPAATTDAITAGITIGARIQLFILAEKWCLSSLKNLAMSNLVAAYIRSNTLPHFSYIQMAYRRTPEGSGLRLFMVRAAHYVLLVGEETTWPSKTLYEIVANNEDLGLDLLRMIRANLGPQDPKKFPPSDYHCQVKNEDVQPLSMADVTPSTLPEPGPIDVKRRRI